MPVNHHHHPRPVGDLVPLEILYHTVVLVRAKFLRGQRLGHVAENAIFGQAYFGVEPSHKGKQGP
ncbi:hypothetical protein BDFG_04421 [Blastomyces dermatitidis ATCC 26199]|nr:hypothetical protein BDFG_04421 [Blastomyces dermatitidis ATCC 26199]